jgi:iron complex outermembrane receptor protein
MGYVRNGFRLVGAGASMLVFTLAAAPTVAQTPPSSSGLEEIVVTAQRRPEPLQSVPISMSAISGVTLEKMGDKNFFDYATTIPNLSVGMGTGSGGNGDGFGVSTSRSVTIRGVAGDNTTGFYLNDTPIPLSVDPRVLDVDRVEVLRGPQGTLFGAGSMGGTVRIFTREPAFEGPSGKVEVEGSDVDHGGAGYSVNGTLNAQLIPDSVALRVSAFSAFDPGLFTRTWGGPQSPLSPTLPFPPGGVAPGQKDHVGADQQTGAMVSLRIVPAGLSGLSVTPMVIYQRSNSNGDPLADYTPGNFTQIRPLNVPETVTDEWVFAGLTAKYEATFGRFVASGTYFHRQAYDDEDGTDSLSHLIALPYYVPFPTQAWLSTRTYNGEARFESALKGPVQFVVGVFSDLTDRPYVTNVPSPGANAATGGALGTDLAFAENSPNVDRQQAGFLDVSYDVTSEFQVSVGARRAHLQHEFTVAAQGYLNGGSSVSTGKYSEDVTTPRYTARYEFSPGQTLYVSAAKGFRIGGVNSKVPDICDAQLAEVGLSNGSPFDSDSLWSYEVGSKNSWAGGLVKSRLAAYHIDWKSIQQTRYLSSCGFNVTTNSGAAVSNGGEFELDAAPVEHLTTNLALGYEHARITEATSGSLTVVGQPLTGVPEWTGSATAQYTVPFGPRDWFVRGQYTYTGSRTSFNNVVTGRNESSYSLVNLRIGMNQDRWEVALFARNLFNKYAELADLLPESAELPGRPRWLIARPRTIGIQLRRDF